MAHNQNKDGADIRSQQQQPERPPKRLAQFLLLDVLPTEDRQAFERLHADLKAEHKPRGRIQEGVVTTIARLLWRRDHLSIFRHAAEVYAVYGSRFEIEDPAKRYATLSMHALTRTEVYLEDAAKGEESVLIKSKEVYRKPIEMALKLVGPIDFEKGFTQSTLVAELDLAVVASQITPAQLKFELEMIEQIDLLIERNVRRLLYLQAGDDRMPQTPLRRQRRHRGPIRSRP